MGNVKKLFTIIVGIIVLLSSICIGCDIITTTTGTYQVEYVVTGTAESVSVLYHNGHDEYITTDISLPWTYSFKAEEGFLASLQATWQSSDITSVTLTIYRDGELFDTSTAIGQERKSFFIKGRL